jgi:limonene-1,2-epoxide hydrolase
MSLSNQETMRRFLALWSMRDAAAMAELFAEDAIYDNVPDKLPMIGRDAIRAWLEICFEHLTRIDVEVLRIAGNGDWVLSERIDDHIVGDRHMPLPVMNAARIVDGRIKLFRDYYDRQTVAELGIGSDPPQSE